MIVGAEGLSLLMDSTSNDIVEEIERIHTAWMEAEIVGDVSRLMALCSDDIEVWPPDSSPVVGRVAAAAWLKRSCVRIHNIEISDLRVRASAQLAYLTANYRTTFSTPDNGPPKQLKGSHLWILQNREGLWLIVLVSWSSCGRTDDLN